MGIDLGPYAQAGNACVQVGFHIPHRRVGDDQHGIEGIDNLGAAVHIDGRAARNRGITVDRAEGNQAAGGNGGPRGDGVACAGCRLNGQVAIIRFNAGTAQDVDLGVSVERVGHLQRIAAEQAAAVCDGLRVQIRAGGSQHVQRLARLDQGSTDVHPGDHVLEVPAVHRIGVHAQADGRALRHGAGAGVVFGGDGDVARCVEGAAVQHLRLGVVFREGRNDGIADGREADGRGLLHLGRCVAGVVRLDGDVAAGRDCCGVHVGAGSLRLLPEQVGDPALVVAIQIGAGGHADECPGLGVGGDRQAYAAGRIAGCAGGRGGRGIHRNVARNFNEGALDVGFHRRIDDGGGVQVADRGDRDFVGRFGRRGGLGVDRRVDVDTARLQKARHIARFIGNTGVDHRGDNRPGHVGTGAQDGNTGAAARAARGRRRFAVARAILHEFGIDFQCAADGHRAGVLHVGALRRVECGAGPVDGQFDAGDRERVGPAQRVRLCMAEHLNIGDARHIHASAARQQRGGAEARLRGRLVEARAGDGCAQPARRAGGREAGRVVGDLDVKAGSAENLPGALARGIHGGAVAAGRVGGGFDHRSVEEIQRRAGHVDIRVGVGVDIGVNVQLADVHARADHSRGDNRRDERVRLASAAAHQRDAGASAGAVAADLRHGARGVVQLVQVGLHRNVARRDHGLADEGVQLRRDVGTHQVDGDAYGAGRNLRALNLGVRRSGSVNLDGERAGGGDGAADDARVRHSPGRSRRLVALNGNARDLDRAAAGLRSLRFRAGGMQNLHIHQARARVHIGVHDVGVVGPVRQRGDYRHAEARKAHGSAVHCLGDRVGGGIYFDSHRAAVYGSALNTRGHRVVGRGRRGVDAGFHQRYAGAGTRERGGRTVRSALVEFRQHGHAPRGEAGIEDTRALGTHQTGADHVGRHVNGAERDEGCLYQCLRQRDADRLQADRAADSDQVIRRIRIATQFCHGKDAHRRVRHVCLARSGRGVHAAARGLRRLRVGFCGVVVFDGEGRSVNV